MSSINATERALTESFRFGETFAVLASRILSLLGEKAPIRGQGKIGSILVEDPSVSPAVDAILCRKKCHSNLAARGWRRGRSQAGNSYGTH